ncbi:hypothetical protein [Methylobacterium sp. Leaf399]|uniref:hypothetical protein n=1 Tax=Methylobacterium sp. Leaf399 TaxID=1736364 RepID=UPI001FCE1AB2|nr:hypothetical protein [Methylobacterium sp. Leaf399]
MSNPVSVFRALSPGFLDALEALAERPGWWQDVLAHPDLILAVRREAVNFYYRGASIFRVTFPNGTVTAETHAKYLLRQRQTTVRLDPTGAFGIDPATAISTSYAGPTTLTEMLRAATALSGLEKTGLHRLLRHAPNVIDVEIALTSSIADSADTDGEDASGALLDSTVPISVSRSPDRLDVASLEERAEPGEAWLVFHEAKIAANPELRAAPSGQPAIVAQVSRYTTTLTREADHLASGYQLLCRDLIRLDALRQRVQRAAGVSEADLWRRDPLVAEVAEGARRLRVDPRPRLVVFGFDADQRDGIFGTHLKRLQAEPFSLAVRAIGNPGAGTSNAFRRP